MPLHLITGHKGEAHISSADVGAFNAGVFGQGEYVLNTGQKFKIEVLSNNAVKIHDGDLIMQGRHISLKSGSSEELTIDNGTVDMNRVDLIVVRYTQDISTGIENAEFAVIKGTPDTEAVAPEYTTGNILSGSCVLHEIPLYKIPISGLSIGEPEKLINEIGVIGDSLSFRGWNPLKSIEEDTPQKWKELGTGIWMIDLPDRIIGQPSQWGLLYNTVCINEVAQKFVVQASGESFRRNANGIGWYGTDWRSGDWQTIYDSKTAPFLMHDYTGDGNWGETSPKRLTFSFKPSFVLIMEGENFMFLHRNSNTANRANCSGAWGKTNNVTWGDNYVEWYTTSTTDGDYLSAGYQMNNSGRKYYYVAWG